jgi:hypothetical protein
MRSRTVLLTLAAILASLSFEARSSGLVCVAAQVCCDFSKILQDLAEQCCSRWRKMRNHVDAVQRHRHAEVVAFT